jgi:hypothetical protein
VVDAGGGVVGVVAGVVDALGLELLLQPPTTATSATIATPIITAFIPFTCMCSPFVVIRIFP